MTTEHVSEVENDRVTLLGVPVAIWSICVTLILIALVLAIAARVNAAALEKKLTDGLEVRRPVIERLAPEALYLRPAQADVIVAVLISKERKRAHWNYCIVKGDSVKATLLETPLFANGEPSSAGRPLSDSMDARLAPLALHQCRKITGKSSN